MSETQYPPIAEPVLVPEDAAEGLTWAGVQAGSSEQIVEIIPSGAVPGDE